MVSERVTFTSLLGVMTVGIGIMMYGIYLSAGQSLNMPAIVGGVILSIAVVAMLVVTVSVFDMQDTPTHGQD